MNIVPSRARTFRAVRITIVIAVAALMIVVPAALAGAGKTSYSVSVPDSSYASTVTGSVSASSGGQSVSTPTDLFAIGRCYQNGNSVYQEHVQADETGAFTLTLGPTPSWEGGAADCTATVRTWDVRRQRWVYLGSDEFHVAG